LAVTTEQIRRLREETGAGIMDCRRALEEAEGNHDRAREVLRERGVMQVAKKAGREARQGLVESYIHAGGRIGAIVEVNCETDFVARTEKFRTLAREIAMQIAAMNPPSIENAGGDSTVEESAPPLLDQPWIRDSSKTIRDLVIDAIATLGENVVVRRMARFELGS
jgi:elongation factor Ts